MNNIVEKIKESFSSSFGKLAGGIIVLSFFVTLILSVLSRNRIDVSLLRSILSAIIIAAILFFIGVVLKKYLGDIVDEVPVSPNANADPDNIDDSANGLDSISNASEDGISNIVPNEGAANNGDEAGEQMIKPDIPKKTNAGGGGGDIGDILFGKPPASPASSYVGDSMFPDKKIDESEIEREVRQDPEKVAKAVRTMMAKDEEEE